MKFAFIPLHRGKLMFGFTRTIVEFDSLAQARSYAKDMKADYAIYGCTSVCIEMLDSLDVDRIKSDAKVFVNSLFDDLGLSHENR